MGDSPEMNKQWMNKGDKAPTWSTDILFGQVDVEMGVWLRVSLGRGKKHGKEKKARVHIALLLLFDLCRRAPSSVRSNYL